MRYCRASRMRSPGIGSRGVAAVVGGGHRSESGSDQQDENARAAGHSCVWVRSSGRRGKNQQPERKAVRKSKTSSALTVPEWSKSVVFVLQNQSAR